jgi:hypothetical protein
MHGTKVGRIVVPALDNVTRINYKNVILQNYAVTTVEVIDRAGSARSGGLRAAQLRAGASFRRISSCSLTCSRL